MIKQINGLFDFIQTNGIIKEFTERNKRGQKIDQSQHGTHKREQNEKIHSLEASTSSNDGNLDSPNNFSKSNCVPSKAKMERVNGLEMHFIYKKRGHSSGTHRLWMERKQILRPGKTRIVGQGRDNERLQEYRSSQQGRKRILELNIQMYNWFLHYCETPGTTPLKECQQNNNESWLSQNLSDNEIQISNVKQKCPVMP